MLKICLKHSSLSLKDKDKMPIIVPKKIETSTHDSISYSRYFKELCKYIMHVCIRSALQMQLIKLALLCFTLQNYCQYVQWLHTSRIFAVLFLSIIFIQIILFFIKRYFEVFYRRKHYRVDLISCHLILKQTQ